VSLHEDQLAYESFLAYCRTIGVDPPEFQNWREITTAGFQQSWRAFTTRQARLLGM
jgi:hypothetical protein